MSRKKDAAAVAGVKIFPPLVPLLTVFSGIGLEYLLPIDPGFSPTASVRYWVGGGIVFLAVLCLGLWSVAIFRRSGESENPWKPTTQIVEKGPYRISRNPMYLQMVVVCVGLAIMLWNVWILLLTPLCAWALQRLAIVPEEAYLEARFGESYTAYKKRVRRWL